MLFRYLGRGIIEKMLNFNALLSYNMANIIIPKPWQENNIKPTDQILFENRREILKKLGFIGGGLLTAPFFLSSCIRSSGSNDEKSFQLVDNNFNFAGMDKYYPTERNKKYTTERPLTDKYLATHKNNFYEFIHPSDKNIYNAYKYVGRFDTRDWEFEVSGHVKKKGRYSLEDIIKKFGLEERTYRFRCVEAWSMAVPWAGFSFAALLKYLEPTNNAKYVRMISFSDEKQMPGVKNQHWYPWPYFEGLRMDEAMNELTFMATGIYGEPMPKQNGAPMRLIVPWKYGYKSIKSIVKLEFIDFEPETFWHKIAPNEYGFLSNVNPKIPHPRWSQAREQMLGEDFKRPTLKFNGYGALVAKMYN